MASNSSKIFEFMQLLGKLKATKRTGWVLRGVKDPESIADHMYRMATMSFLIGNKLSINKDRCIKISLVHDMAESMVGDLVPADNVSKQDKYSLEKGAMEHIRTLVSPEIGEELCTLWQEYEDQKTPESKFVKDLDRFDMILQAFEYEQSDMKPGFLQEFFDSTKDKFEHPAVQEWVEDLYKRREEHIKSTSTAQNPS